MLSIHSSLAPSWVQSTERAQAPIKPGLTPMPSSMPTPTPPTMASPMTPAPFMSALNEKGTILDATVEELSKNDLWVHHCPHPEDHQPTDSAPSLYLQMACPPATLAIFLLFLHSTAQPYGQNPIANSGCWFSGSFHSVGSIDGNFEQMHLQHAGSGDQAIPKGHTFFLTSEEILQAQHEVDQHQKSATKSHATTEEDSIIPGLSLPNYIYDGCNSWSIAGFWLLRSRTRPRLQFLKIQAWWPLCATMISPCFL